MTKPLPGQPFRASPQTSVDGAEKKQPEKGEFVKGTKLVFRRNNSLNNSEEGTKKLAMSSHRISDQNCEAESHVNAKITHHNENKKITSKVNATNERLESQKIPRTIPRPPPPSSPPPLTTTSARTGSPLGPPAPTDSPPRPTTSTRTGSPLGPPAPTDLPPPPPKNSAKPVFGELQKVYLNFQLAQKDQIVADIKKLIPFTKLTLDENHKNNKELKDNINKLKNHIEEFGSYSVFEENVDHKTMEEKKDGIIKAFSAAYKCIKNNKGSSNEMASIIKSIMNYSPSIMNDNSNPEW